MEVHAYVYYDDPIGVVLLKHSRNLYENTRIATLYILLLLHCHNKSPDLMTDLSLLFRK